jgi:hypothetical protein
VRIIFDFPSYLLEQHKEGHMNAASSLRQTHCIGTGDSWYMRLHYPRFYFNVMRSINILSLATVEAVAHVQ